MRNRKNFSPVYYLIFTLAVLLVSCTPSQTSAPAADPPENTSTPTPAEPTPTLTPTATRALLPTLTPQPTNTQAQPARPDQAAAPEPDTSAPDFGLAAVNFLQPGQYSRLVSPIRILANLQTSSARKVQITLFGEDGRIVAEKEIYAKPYDDPLNGNLITDIDFKIEGLAEAGRLELKVLDSFGRIETLNSVNLVLMSTPPNDRNYAPENAERIQLQLPFPGQTEIQGSPLLISGLVLSQSDHPIDIWLVDESGATLGLTQAAIVRSPDSSAGQFIGEVNFAVDEPTRVLMLLAISDSRIPGYTYVKSVALVLNP